MSDTAIEGGLKFHIGVRTTPETLAKMSPNELRAFFAGLAKIVGAASGASVEVTIDGVSIQEYGSQLSKVLCPKPQEARG